MQKDITSEKSNFERYHKRYQKGKKDMAKDIISEKKDIGKDITSEKSSFERYYKRYQKQKKIWQKISFSE